MGRLSGHYQIHLTLQQPIFPEMYLERSQWSDSMNCIQKL